MASNIFPILIPKENVSDTVYTVVACHVENGQKVEKGEIILELESSKNNIEISAEHEGYLYINVKESQTVEVGTLCAAISPEPQLAPQYFEKQITSINNIASEGAKSALRISTAARTLLKKHNLQPQDIKQSGLLRTADITTYLHAQEPAKTKLPIPTSSKKSIIILGAGGHAKMCIDMLRQMGNYEIYGLVDNTLKPGTEVLDLPVLGPDALLPDIFAQGVQHAVIGIGALSKPTLRNELFSHLSKIGFNLPNLIHPKAIIEPSAQLNNGIQIMAGAIIGSAAQIGSNSIINSGAIVSHDSILEENVHLTPGAVLAGNVHVGSNTIIGMASSVYLGVRVGKNNLIPNGTHILKNIPDKTI